MAFVTILLVGGIALAVGYFLRGTVAIFSDGERSWVKK